MMTIDCYTSIFYLTVVLFVVPVFWRVKTRLFWPLMTIDDWPGAFHYWYSLTIDPYSHFRLTILMMVLLFPGWHYWWLTLLMIVMTQIDYDPDYSPIMTTVHSVNWHLFDTDDLTIILMTIDGSWLLFHLLVTDWLGPTDDQFDDWFIVHGMIHSTIRYWLMMIIDILMTTLMMLLMIIRPLFIDLMMTDRWYHSDYYDTVPVTNPFHYSIHWLMMIIRTGCRHSISDFWADLTTSIAIIWPIPGDLMTETWPAWFGLLTRLMADDHVSPDHSTRIPIVLPMMWRWLLEFAFVRYVTIWLVLRLRYSLVFPLLR